VNSARDRWAKRRERHVGEAQRWLDLRRKDLAWWSVRKQFLAAWPALVRRHRWVFLVGCNNSGTTLVHDRLARTGNFSYLAHEGQRYTEVIRRAEKRGHERVWSEYMTDLELDETGSIDRVPRLWFDWLREMPTPVKARILEKTTANAVRMRWLQRAFPDACFVGVVRNGYAVVEGIARKGVKDVGRGARHWRIVNERMLDDAAAIERFCLLRYEDLVSDPGHTLDRLLHFVGLEGHEIGAALRRAEQAARSGAGGEEIRDMNAGSLARLTRPELDAINHEASPLLARLGYDVL